MTTFKAYSVVNNQFSNNEFHIRFAGNDTAPVFVAKDVILAMGYGESSITHVTETLPGLCEIDRLRTSGRGNHVMLGITKEDVDILLARKRDPRPTPEKSAKKAAFRIFWENEVLPQIEHPELRAKIVSLESEVAKLRAQLSNETA